MPVQFLSELWKKPPSGRRFIGAWMRAPFTVGAIVPSSRTLARALAAQLDRKAPGTIVELGAGTGVVTEAILQAGFDSSRLLVVERDAALVRFIAHHFPGLNVVCADAAHLPDALAGQGVTQVAAIVSSLPLLSMPKPLRLMIEKRMAEAIGQGGRIIQFTYGPKSPISEETLNGCGLSGHRVRTVLANFPPAHVWVYTARDNTNK